MWVDASNIHVFGLEGILAQCFLQSFWNVHRDILTLTRNKDSWMPYSIGLIPVKCMSHHVCICLCNLYEEHCHTLVNPLSHSV